MPKAWNRSVIQAFEVISVKLFVTNPVLRQVLNDWYRDLRYTVYSICCHLS